MQMEEVLPGLVLKAHTRQSNLPLLGSHSSEDAHTPHCGQAGRDILQWTPLLLASRGGRRNFPVQEAFLHQKIPPTHSPHIGPRKESSS